MRKWWIALLCLLLAIGVIVAVRSSWTAQQPDFTPPNFGLLPVTALKLDPDLAESMKHLGQNDAACFHSWRILTQQPLSEQQANRLRQALNAPSTYGGSSEKCFEPELAFRFGATIEVLISMKCSRIQFVENHQSRSEILSRQGVEILEGLKRELFAK